MDLVRSENVGMVGTVSARSLVSQKKDRSGDLSLIPLFLPFMEKSYLVGTALIQIFLARKIQTSYPCKFVHSIESFISNNEDIISL